MTAMPHCQRWNRHTMSWQYAAPGRRFTGRGYDVAAVSFAAARDFVREHHYLHSLGADVKRYGLFHRAELFGVAVYGVPSNPKVITNWLPDLAPVPRGDGTYRWPALVLQRLVLLDRVGGNAESWFTARCRELLTDAEVYGTVTFADPMPLYADDGTCTFKGHAGILYQADNWVYGGIATARAVLITRTGVRLDPRTLQKIRAQEPGHAGAERTLVALGADPMRPGENPAAYLNRALTRIGPRTIAHTGCHRYIRTHRPDVAIVHKGQRVRHDPRRYPKPSPDLLALVAGR